MTTQIIDSSNSHEAISLLSKGGKYFIIATEVTFPIGTTKIGTQSVLDFRGGCFKGTQSAEVKIEGNQIIAGTYGIFQGLKVSGLANSRVLAEWFKPVSGVKGDEEYINKAIEAAHECPVFLENRTYTLNNPITFSPSTGNNETIRRTFICPGTLKVNHAGPAVDVNCHGTSIKINRIIGTSAPNGKEKYQGQGISITDYVVHADIEVYDMKLLNRGFNIVPDATRKVVDDGQLPPVGVQYCRFKFGTILADYCFYVDIYSKAMTLPVPSNGSTRISNWFNENQISGSVMMGLNGIYMVDPEDVWMNDPNINTNKINSEMNGLVFENISFEHLTGLPVRLRRLNMCRFLNLQMSNNLPGTDEANKDPYATWIDLKNIDNVEMTFNSYIHPNHIKAHDNCNNSYIRGDVVDDESWFRNHFDTIGIDVLYDVNNAKKSQLYATSSIQPYNMSGSIVAMSNTEKTIRDILPHVRSTVSDASQNTDLCVLPSSLNAVVKQGVTLTLDISGLMKFAQCIYTVNADIALNGVLRFKTYDNIRIVGGTYSSGGIYTKDVIVGGLYQLQWTSNWEIEIIRIAH